MVLSILVPNRLTDLWNRLRTCLGLLATFALSRIEKPSLPPRAKTLNDRPTRLSSLFTFYTLSIPVLVIQTLRCGLGMPAAILTERLRPTPRTTWLILGAVSVFVDASLNDMTGTREFPTLLTWCPTLRSRLMGLLTSIGNNIGTSLNWPFSAWGRLVLGPCRSMGMVANSLLIASVLPLIKHRCRVPARIVSSMLPTAVFIVCLTLPTGRSGVGPTYMTPPLLSIPLRKTAPLGCGVNRNLRVPPVFLVLALKVLSVLSLNLTNCPGRSVTPTALRTVLRGSWIMLIVGSVVPVMRLCPCWCPPLMGLGWTVLGALLYRESMIWISV